jgi:hypothetical protein
MNIIAVPDPSRADRLYALLPAIHRMRDADQGYPLKALLRVLAEQVNVLEDDITQLYENWFIETAQDWVVPYIGDLVGYRALAEAGLPPDESCCEISPVLVPRREIANLIRYRRRKGTLSLLELLARDVADWPSRAVEYFKLLGWNQNMDHLHLGRHRTVDVRDVNALDLLDGPFDSISHTVDVRRIDSARTRGRYNIPSVGVFLWRLRSYSVTRTPAYCVEESGPQCYTFSTLGQDAPLFVRPQPETDPTHIAREINLPAPIRRLAFDEHPEVFYGPDLSFAIWADGWAGAPSDRPIPVSQLIPADLSEWKYVTPLNRVAVDPVLGRLEFPPGQLPKKGVRVSYRYGFPADMGGGEYPRVLEQQPGDFTLYRVGDTQPYRRIADAVTQWQQDKPAKAIIEIEASAVYVEQLSITLDVDQTLQIRAANRARPVLRMIDWQTDLPDALSITLGAGSRFELDGLLITGRPVSVQGAPGPTDRNEICAAEVSIRHCTLVPGWAIDCDCGPLRPAEPSLELTNVRARICITNSIVGSIQIQEDEVALDPLPLNISDSVVDATGADKLAIGAPGEARAHAVLDVRRCTVFGIVDVNSMQLGENSIFTSCVNVARRQIGCMRYCFVPYGCRTPRRYHCQPDGVIAAVMDKTLTSAQRAAEIANEKLRVAPQFTARRYGRPAYGQLALDCAIEIRRGADDESEMGAFHDLYQPQREAHLNARLAEFTPAGMDVGTFFAN